MAGRGTGQVEVGVVMDMAPFPTEVIYVLK